MERQAEKAACRALALSRRRALAPEERRARSLQICRALEGLEELRGLRTVLGYVPSGSECDLRPFYETLRKRGVSVAFPVTLSGGEMEAYVPVEPLLPGRCGIPEPDAAVSRLVPPEELDAVLVPCAGFDDTLCRLGHGMGYYDRYLPRCTRAAAILTAFEAQRLERVPTEPHDFFFRAAVTEKGVFRK